MAKEHFPRFPVVALPHLDEVQLPKLARVRLRQPVTAPLPNLVASVEQALSRRADLFALPEGSSIAVAVGSRGVADIDVITRTAVRWLKAQGLAPFIVPAMGSHGGGTAAGQADVLGSLGITEDAMGCPLCPTMETVEYGQIESGITCHFDANAAAASGVLVINRVKAHTSFPRPVESGLTKMLAVGLGKAEGARQVHVRGPRGLSEVLPQLAARIVERAPISAGLAVVENADKQVSEIEVAAPTDFYAVDERLLRKAKAAMARLPFAQIDGLVVEELGKDISGAGIDPAISGRTDIRGVENPVEPFVHKIAALDLSARTGGNGIGVGMADYIPRRMAERLDLRAMYMNAISATIVEKAYIPIVLPDDLTCVRALVATGWSEGAARLCQIQSSARLDWIAVTAPLLEELRELDLVLDSEGFSEMVFDKYGCLTSKIGDLH